MRRIAEARVDRSNDWLKPLLDGWNGSARVMVRFDDSEEWEQFFGFYHDEISFTADEFVGLTEQEAKDLFFRRDMDYLRS